MGTILPFRRAAPFQQDAKALAKQYDDRYHYEGVTLEGYVDIMERLGADVTILPGLHSIVDVHNALFDDSSGSDIVQKVRQLYGFARALAYSHKAVDTEFGASILFVSELPNVIRDDKLSRVHSVARQNALDQIKTHGQIAEENAYDGKFPLHRYLDLLFREGNGSDKIFRIHRWLEHTFPGVRLVEKVQRGMNYSIFASALNKSVGAGDYSAFGELKEHVHPRFVYQKNK